MKLYTINEYYHSNKELLINESIDKGQIKQMISDAIKYGLSLQIDVNVLTAEEIGSILKLAGECFVISF
jgi:hypothetical protein